MAQFINPYTDFGFKKLFGEEGSKDLLKDFLNELLPEEPIFRKGFLIAELAGYNTDEIFKYEASLKSYRDLKGVIDTSFEEGEKLGLE